MSGKLIVVSGPLAGRMLELNDAELTVGRETTNSFAIPDSSVSRIHCRFRADADGWTVEDCESRNGTFVNGVPVGVRRLVSGDRVDVGRCSLTFTDSSELAMSDEFSPTRTVLGGPINLHSDVVRKMARDLKALVTVATAINSINDALALKRALVDVAAEALQAGSVTLVDVCWGEIQDSLVTSQDHTHPVLVRDTLAEAVKQRRSATWHDGDGQQLTAYPLVAAFDVTGVLVVCLAPPRSIDQEAGDLLAALCPIAGVALENASRLSVLRDENTRLNDALGVKHDLIGETPAMQRVVAFIGKASTADATVLIRGESGTGKELVARAIHLNGARKDGPFVAINCAALTETLLESELFGYEKGAFTGAMSQKKGRIEIANDGTLFLDEIGELAPTLQAKLLRVLQQREFERVGGTRPIRINVRVVAATNRDLEQAIKSGGFRPDLFYRLNVLTVHMPALRERRDDVPLLAAFFLSKYSDKCCRRMRGFTPQARELLTNYAWPGNVRELENAIERAVVLGNGEFVEPEDLPDVVLESANGSEFAGHFHDEVNSFKRQLILTTLERVHGDYVKAAAELDIHTNNLHRLIRTFNLKNAVAVARGHE